MQYYYPRPYTGRMRTSNYSVRPHPSTHVSSRGTCTWKKNTSQREDICLTMWVIVLKYTNLSFFLRMLLNLQLFYSSVVMATFKQAKCPTEFLTVEEVAAIFADRKSIDILSEVSSYDSATDSFWKSSAADSAGEQESDPETEFSGSAPPEFLSDSWSVLMVPTEMTLTCLLRKENWWIWWWIQWRWRWKWWR